MLASKVWAPSLADLSHRIKTTQDNTNHDGGALRALAGRLTVGWTVAGAAIHPRLVRLSGLRPSIVSCLAVISSLRHPHDTVTPVSMYGPSS